MRGISISNETKERIVELKKTGMKQKDIAEKCGTTPQTVCRILKEISVSKQHTNEVLANFTPRQLIDELKARGYYGELKYTNIIKL